MRAHWDSSWRCLWPFLSVAAWKTTLGFEIRTVGANPDAAKYAGINVKKTIVITMAISGAAAGLAGAIEVNCSQLPPRTRISSGYGFDAIAIALLGKTNPYGVILAAILFGAMRKRRNPHAVPNANSQPISIFSGWDADIYLNSLLFSWALGAHFSHTENFI